MRTALLLCGIVASLFASASAGNVTTHSSANTTNINTTTAAAADDAHDTSNKHFDCGVTAKKASAHFNQTIRLLHTGRRPKALSQRPGLHIRDTPKINVPTVFHIITKTSPASKNSITPAMVTAQINTLNGVYNKYNIHFDLLNTTWIANDAWAVGAGTDGDALKAALRQGSYATLNIYFQTDLHGSILGTCSLPSEIGPAPVPASTYASDGCNVQAGTMPGGSILGYSAGKTAVHETGHWLGLLHTFEGYSCSGDGDFIADTPVQSTSTDGCPTKPAKDSCPMVSGVDAVHNFMDYSTDACYTNFTPGQMVRIGNLWTAYRQGR